jgi:hypothetical protein
MPPKARACLDLARALGADALAAKPFRAAALMDAPEAVLPQKRQEPMIAAAL